MEELSFPNPGKSVTPIKLDMTKVLAAEARVPEIAFVTPTKGPELMATFSEACFILGRYVANVYFNHRMAKKRVGDRAAILLIDTIPGVLAEKGLKENEQNRQALLDLDPEYSAAVVAEAQTDATLMLIERKLRDMEGALNAVKKAVETQGGIFGRSNPNLQTGGVDWYNPAPSQTPVQPYISTPTPQPSTTDGRGPFKIGKPTF